MFRDNDNYDEYKATSVLKLASNRQSTRDSTYSRLCKSFTLLTRQSSFKQPRKKPTKTKKFSSEPVKLNNTNSSSSNSNNTSLKRVNGASYQHKLNYLKNLTTFEQHIEIESLQLLVKKLENVTNLSTLLKSITAKPCGPKTYHDASVQTSMTYIATSKTCADTSSQSSSFNSHGTTTIMQTNCFGSIVGNFGSAMIQPYPINSRFGGGGGVKGTVNAENHQYQSKFLRSHSDDYGLSTDDNETSPMLSSASSSKLAKLRLMKT
jgi:hypothetical protein